MIAQKAITTNVANNATATYCPLAIPALKIMNSLMKMAKGGAPAIAKAPSDERERRERRQSEKARGWM